MNYFIYTSQHVVMFGQKTLDPDYLAAKQFSKMEAGSDEFACACVCVEFRFHLGHPYCLQSRSQSPRVFWSAPTKRHVGSGNEIAM